MRRMVLEHVLCHLIKNKYKDKYSNTILFDHLPDERLDFHISIFSQHAPNATPPNATLK